MKFRIGDRVQRRIDIYGENSKMKLGTIIDAYSLTHPGLGRHYPELYQVQWDDGKVDAGFLPYGLEPAPTNQKV